MTPTLYRLLLVDDDYEESLLVRHMLSRVTEIDEYQLDWVATYDEGLVGLLQGNYDAYLVDYNLGERSGLELVRAARDAGCRAPIIMLTGRGSLEIDQEAMASGVTEYLEKNSLRPVMLTRTVRYAIKHVQDQIKLEDLNARLQQLEQLKTDMIRIAAHDLRGPLMIILSYARNLNGLLAGNELGQDYTDEIVNAAQRMHNIVSDILSLERIAEIAANIQFEEVDMGAVVEEAVAQWRSVAQEKKLDYSITHLDAVTIAGDSVQLQRACSNLVSNAIKYTPEGGRVCVSLEVDGLNERLIFAVEDTGYGIPADKQDQLFQPFYRVRTRESRSATGMGLGLHLVKNIVERHNGELLVESVYGKGSIFGFTLPLR